jgi:hypothetical protein
MARSVLQGGKGCDPTHHRTAHNPGEGFVVAQGEQ